MHTERFAVPLLMLTMLLFVACSEQMVLPIAMPTVYPDIYNVVPGSTVFEPGQCTVLLDSPAPAYTLAWLEST